MSVCLHSLCQCQNTFEMTPCDSLRVSLCIFIEACVLRAGISFLMGNYNDCLLDLQQAHAQRSEATTLAADQVDACMPSSDQESTGGEAGGVVPKGAGGEDGELPPLGRASRLSHLDNGKATEYRQRSDMVECLVSGGSCIIYRICDVMSNCAD